jgi:hypothetical protein
MNHQELPPVGVNPGGPRSRPGGTSGTIAGLASTSPNGERRGERCLVRYL